MTASRTNLRLASAAVAGMALMTTSLAAVVIPGLASADQNGPKQASASASSTAQPKADRSTDSTRAPKTSTAPKASTATSSGSNDDSSPSASPRVTTTNAPGSTASFGPTQEWDVLDPRFNKNKLNLLAGETFVVYADVLHSQPLEQDLSIRVDKLVNLKCEPKNETAEAGADSGLETFAVECMITKGNSRVSGYYQLVQADGTVIGEGVFAASPNADPSNPSASSTAATPGGTSDNKPTASPTSTTSKPASTAGAKSEIAIAKARFEPASFPLRVGQKFVVNKDVTISGVPLHSALTMQITKQQNLDCTPTSAKIPEGAEGTKTLTFSCEITGVDPAPGAWYSITLADGTKLVTDAYFGLDSSGGMAEGERDNGKQTKIDTSGGLADTGAPAVGVFLAGALVSTVAGAQLIRRRRG